MLYFLDLLGTFAFAITGAYKAKGASLNIFGVIFLGVATSVGGGTFRDLIIGRTPLFYLKDPNYLLIAILAGIITYFSPTFFKRRYSFFRFIDSIGLAAFAAIGVSISFSLFQKSSSPTFFSFILCVFLGMITGLGGGIIRDSIMGQVPFCLKSGSNYTASAFWGAFSFYFLSFVDVRLAIFMSMIVTLAFREIVSDFGIYKKLVKKNTVFK